MQIIRFILWCFSIFLLLAAVALMWGMLPIDWLTGYLIGSLFLGYAFSLMWVAYTQTYRALVGLSLGLMITLAAIAFIVLRSGRELYWLGTGSLYAAFLSLWFFILGLKVSKKNTNRLPISVQYLFALVFTASLLEGVYLAIKVPDQFIWALANDLSLLYGWALIGIALFFGWALLKPVWEHGYPQLYTLVLFDLAAIGPILSLFQDPRALNEPISHLWIAVVAIVVTGSWGVIELARRLIGSRKGASR